MKFRIDRLYVYLVAIVFGIQFIAMALTVRFLSWQEGMNNLPIFKIYSAPAVLVVQGLFEPMVTAGNMSDDMFLSIAILTILILLPLFWVTVAYFAYRGYQRYELEHKAS